MEENKEKLNENIEESKAVEAAKETIVKADPVEETASVESLKKEEPKKEEKEEPAKEGSEKYGLPSDHHEIGELKQRIEQRKKEKKKKQRRFRTWVYVTAFLFMALVFGFFFSISGFFTVDSIDVKGNKHYTNEEIINMAHAVPGRNLIYETNKDEIVSYLEKNPYIKSAEVIRQFPSTLLIRVVEREEKMAFKYDDDYLVMDGEGILLKKSRNAPTATLVEGLVVNKIKLGEKIGTEDTEKTNQAIELIKQMSEFDLYFVKLDVSDMKKVKAYVYDNMVVKTDYNTLMANIKNGHIHQVLEKLFKDGIKRGTITFEEDGSVSFMPII